MSMSSSDERHEVARKLRDCIFYAKGHDLDGDCDMCSDKCVETRCTLYNDIAACIEEGGNVYLSAEEVFTRLADLIDQTCRNESSSSDYFRCSECGAELMQITPGWVALVNGRVNYCPNCGARVVTGDGE